MKKEFIWTVTSQVITLLGGLLLIKLLAKMLSTEDYGFYALLMSIMSLVLMLPFTAFLQGVGRYVSIYEKRNEYDKFISSVLMIFFSLIAVYSVFAIGYKETIGVQKGLWDELFYLILFLISSELIKILYRTIKNAKRGRKIITLSIVIEFGLKIGFLYYIYLQNFSKIDLVIKILLLSNILSFLVMLSGERRFVFDMNKSLIHFQRIWLFSSPLLLWAIFGWLRDMSNRWYLDYFLDKEQVALFAMVGSIAMIAPTALSGIIGGFVVPILYQKENVEEGYTWKFTLKLLPVVSLVFILSFIVTYIYKNEIILIVSDEKYLEISWMLPWLYLVFCLYTLATLSIFEIFAHKQTKKLVLANIIPGVISVVFGFFLIKEYGIEGALLNYIFTYLSYSILTFYVVLQYSKVKT